MLVLTRKIGEQIVIGDNIVVQVVEISGNRIRLGITAPASVAVKRQELLELPAPCHTVPAKRTAESA